MKILSFGEILWDVINGTEHLGGAPFNFAAHAAQCGNESFIVSRLGSDFLGMRAFNKSKAYGVDGTLVEWDEVYPTGIVDVTLENGQPDYTIRPNVAYDFINGIAAHKMVKMESFDIFYFGSLAQRNTVSANALKLLLAEGRFTHVFYDVNLRKSGYTENIIKDSLRACTIFKLNKDEVGVISEMLAGATLSNEQFCKCVTTLFSNVKIVLITASEQGCFLFINEQLLYVPGTPVEVMDAVGAGDAFSAAFMHVYAHTKDALKAAHIANEVGAYVATKNGAIPEYSLAIKDLLRPIESKDLKPVNKLSAM